MSESMGQLNRLLEVGRFREAAQLLSQVMREEPDSADLRIIAARIALGQDDLDEARLQVGEALSRDPKSFPGRWILYVVEDHAGRHAEAEAVLIDLIRDAPGDAELLAHYADLMLRTLQLQKARQLTNEALRLDPEEQTARRTDTLLSICEGDAERAQANVEELIRENPDSAQTAYMLLNQLIDRGRDREALELGQELLRAEPDDEELIEALVELRARSHWLALPLRPLRVLGWAGSIGIWLFAVLLFSFARRFASPWVVVLAFLYVAWAAYTWIYPPLMSRWIRARGI